MAYVARPKADASGVYAKVHRYFEKDWERWEENLSRWHRTGAPYPCQRILDGFRAGETVNVPSYAVPGQVLQSAPSHPGPVYRFGPQAGKSSRIYPTRAIISPDDTITFNDQGFIELWFEENDI